MAKRRNPWYCLHCEGTERFPSGGCKSCVTARSKRNRENLTLEQRAHRNKQGSEYNKRNYNRVLFRHRKKYPAPTRPEPEYCEMCGKKPNKRLNLDHCHINNIFRGWLCWGCNVALGKLGDSISGAIRMLKRYEEIVNAD